MELTLTPRSIPAVACTVCGCVCDDLIIHTDGERIVRAEKACALAEPWFLQQKPGERPVAESSGSPVSLSQALNQATEILRKARRPLIYGLSRSTTEGQRAAVELAELLGATIDTTAATGHAPSLMALQQAGESTCTLGEVKNRADLVIYWASDPLTTHPRHAERYAVEPEGMFLPGGRKDRYVVIVDTPENRSQSLADQFIALEPGRDWEVLQSLRCLVAGLPISESPGANPEALRGLAERMKACRFGIVFFGGSLARGAAGHRHVESLLRLVTKLNDFTRFYARRMRRLGDVAGADSVMTWQTGYPFAVDFSRRYPRYNPGEFSGPEILARGETDAVLFIGSETVPEFPPAALEHLRKVPVIALETPVTETPVPVTVRFTTAIYGIHRPGTAYRMDEVPIPLKVLLPTDYPADSEVLQGILQRLRHAPVGE